MWTDNSGNPGNTDTFDGFVKITTPTDYIFSVNGKNGYQIVLNPDDLNDSVTDHKFVTQTEKDNWNSTHASVQPVSSNWDSVYSWVKSDSGTNNSAYNDLTYINAAGDTMTGDLTVAGQLSGTTAIFTSITALSSVVDVIDIKVRELSGYDIIDGDLLVDGKTTLNTTILSGETHSLSSVTIDENLYVRGDLHVDGNTFLSGGVNGTINIGDDNTDNVVFAADVNSDITPDVTDTHDLGSETKRWNKLHAVTAEYDILDTDNINVYGITTLSGKTESGPGVVINGTPTGIFDINTPGFEDRDGDYMIPDVDITGDVVLHGSLSADEAHVYSLTASNFRAEYQKLVVNDGDLEIHNGTFRQRGGNMLIDGDIGHIDDENTYIRFSQDSIKFVCHDLNMMQFNEYPVEDDIIILGDSGDSVDFKIQNPADLKTFFVDGDSGNVGIGTDLPTEKLEIYHGNVQFAPGDRDGAVLITAGESDTRVEKRGSIRWNTELQRYEGYNDVYDVWMSFTELEDTDGDTRISLDAEEGSYTDSDRIGLYTAGCSAMTIYPDQTVAFAGDIRFDNITVYDESQATGPLVATSEFIYLKVNGKDRAIRLWNTPFDTREELQTIHGEDLIDIDPDKNCTTGIEPGTLLASISAKGVLADPPPDGVSDSDGDGIVDSIDTDDDNDGIPDSIDADHPTNRDKPDLDGDGIVDEVVDEEFSETKQWEDGDEVQWTELNTTWDQLSS